MQEENRFGRALDGLRASRNQSQAELARALGVSENDVSRWLRGRGINIRNVRKVADYFGVERAWLEDLAGYSSGHPPTPDPVAPELQARLARMGTILSGLTPAVWQTVLSAFEQMTEVLTHPAVPPVSGSKRPPVRASGGSLNAESRPKSNGLTTNYHRLILFVGGCFAMLTGDVSAS